MLLSRRPAPGAAAARARGAQQPSLASRPLVPHVPPAFLPLRAAPKKQNTRRAVATVETTRLDTITPSDLAALPLAAGGDEQQQQQRATNAAAPAAAPAEATPDAALFDFERAWYPLALLETLKTDRPNALTLCGKSVVVWRPLTAGPQQAPPSDERGRGIRRRFADGDWADPAADGWVVQADLCPHRLAPLSEGRLESDGTVQCSYHGWRFSPEGKTTLIPQMEKLDPAAHARACSHPKSCVAVHPCRAFAGVLWVWGEGGGAEVAARAAAAPPTCVPSAMMAAAAAQQAGPGAGSVSRLPRLRPAGAGWYSRDVPVGLDVLLENFVDNSHVNFSHHQVIGDRDADQSMTMRLVSPRAARESGGGYCADEGEGEGGGEGGGGERGPISRDGGFSYEVKAAGQPPFLVHWRPPGHAWFEFPPPPEAASTSAAAGDPPGRGRGDVSMVLYATPTKPGWSRVFVTMLSPQNSPQTTPPLSFLPPIAQAIIALIDKFPALQHALNRNAILDGDDLFLAAQQRVLYGAPGSDHTSWRGAYYLPASTDVGVAALRRWIDVHGRRMPFLPQRSAGEGEGEGEAAQRQAEAPAARLPQLGRAEVFDRYEQHTKDCPHCSSALRGCERALWALAVVGVAAAGAAAFGALAAALQLVSQPARAWGVSAASAAVAAACALVARAVWALRGLFVHYDYQHAEH